MFCRHAKLPIPESISKTAPSYALVFSTISSFIFIWKFNDTWLSVKSIFSLSVYTNGWALVLYVAKYTCDNSVMVPMCELALYAPCNVHSLLVPFNGHSRSIINCIFVYCIILKDISVDMVSII